MPMNWNAEAEAKLFAAFLKTSEAPKLNYEEMAKYMGPDCTAKAVQHRIAHIKQIVKTLVADDEAAPAANGKDTGAGTPKSAKSAKKRGSDEVEDGENGSRASAKKVKTPKKATPKAKKEEVEAMIESDADGASG